MWSDRFDGELADIFEFQDAIARRIAGTLAANIALVEGRRSLDQPKPNPNAFDLVLRARALGHASTRTANRRFRELIAKAIELDPNYAMARALLAEALYSQAVLGWTEFTDRELRAALMKHAKRSRWRPTSPMDTVPLVAFILRAPNTIRRRTRSSARSKSIQATPMPWRYGGVAIILGPNRRSDRLAPVGAETRSHA